MAKKNQNSNSVKEENTPFFENPDGEHLETVESDDDDSFIFKKSKKKVDFASAVENAAADLVSVELLKFVDFVTPSSDIVNLIEKFFNKVDQGKVEHEDFDARTITKFMSRKVVEERTQLAKDAISDPKKFAGVVVKNTMTTFLAKVRNFARDSIVDAALRQAVSVKFDMVLAFYRGIKIDEESVAVACGKLADASLMKVINTCASMMGITPEGKNAILASPAYKQDLETLRTILGDLGAKVFRSVQPQ